MKSLTIYKKKNYLKYVPRKLMKSLSIHKKNIKKSKNC